MKFGLAPIVAYLAGTALASASQHVGEGGRVSGVNPHLNARDEPVAVAAASPAAVAPVTAANATYPQSLKIIQAGQATEDDIASILGSNYGKNFNITLVNKNGGDLGFVAGTFKLSLDPANVIPNYGNVSIAGNAEEVKKKLNTFSYDYVYNAVNKKYGPFLILFVGSDDPTLKGNMKGVITAARYDYLWSFTG